MSVAFVLIGVGLLLMRRARSVSPPQVVLPSAGSTPRRDQIDGRDLPAVLDLAAVALRGGAAPGPALAAASLAATGVVRDTVREVAGLLSLGVEPAVAWTRTAAWPGWETVAALGVRSGESGTRLADVLSRAAEEQRERDVSSARQAAARLGTWAVLPLGLCFLPAFVCVGVVPAVVGIAATALP